VQELVIFPRLALSLNILAHQFAHDLRSRAAGSFCFGYEFGTQLGFELHGENGFFRHNPNFL
jgi:hypothetical protein